MSFRPFPADRVYLSQSVSEPAFGGEAATIFYVRGADGRRGIVRQSLQSGLGEVVTTEPQPGGGVGYGNGTFTVRQDLLVYAARDSLQAIDLATGEQWRVGPAFEGVASPALSPDGRFVAYLAESDGRCNVLVAEVRGSALPVKISHDPWYAFNPAFSPDGSRLAWQEWDEWKMPWDESRIAIASFASATPGADSAARLLPVTVRTIAQPDVAHGAPLFSPDGSTLAFISDASGWHSLHVADPDGGSIHRLDTGEGEIGEPDWVPGRYPYRWSPDGRSIVAVRNRGGWASLLRISWPAGVVRDLPTGSTWIESLDVGPGGHLLFLASGPQTPTSLVTMDGDGDSPVPRATGAIGLVDSASLAPAEPVSWQTEGAAPCHGLLVRAIGPKASGPPPLLVMIHGGPTSLAVAAWSPFVQYFATRGWSCLLPNHRGSTGHGRAYQDLLRGQWGVVDVEDARTGARHLVELGAADPDRLVIHGGSAGGYTTLMALARDPDFWAAGVSLFGIADLYGLKSGSHRFELNYEEALLGKLPGAGPLWKERSPLTHAGNVRSPLLLFHGTEDKAVPHQQSVDFAAAIRARGGIAELISYQGEGHGFGREANRRDMLEKMERFLDRYVIARQR